MMRASLFVIAVLIAGHRAAEAQPVVVFDNLPADTPVSAEGFAVQRAFEDPYVFEGELAARFVAPAGEPLRLERLLLGLFRGPSESGAALVTVTDERDGQPGDAVLDVIPIASEQVPVFGDALAPVAIASRARPVLTGGQAYWIVLSPAPPADEARRVSWAVGGDEGLITAVRTSIDPDRQPRGAWFAFESDVRLRIEARPVDSPPAGGGDGYAVDEDRALAVAAPGVLANDVDDDGDPLVAVLEVGPAHGALVLRPDGSFSYAPAADYHGPDGFRYRISDGDLLSEPIDVAITVTSINDAPVDTVAGTQTLRLGLGLLETARFDLAVADVDAGGGALQVTLTATNGRMSLRTTSGLTFAAGDGASDATMTFTGTLSAIDSALTGLRYTPSLLGFTLAGRGTVTITSNDLGNSGAPGPLIDSDTVTIVRG
jgi:hypothetical protein